MLQAFEFSLLIFTKVSFMAHQDSANLHSQTPPECQPLWMCLSNSLKPSPRGESQSLWGMHLQHLPEPRHFLGSNHSIPKGMNILKVHLLDVHHTFVGYNF